jgi:N-methylhydantoinase A/oxoprolinase/acetone carboxylase beta subunit
VLEGRYASTALIATAGFTDVVELGRQRRASLYRLCERGPQPLTPAERRFPAPERMTPDGPLLVLDEDDAAAVARQVLASSPEAVAVVLLHAYRHPEHERRLGEALRRLDPELHVSLSHEVVGTFREYERAATTELDAGLSPLLAGYLRQLGARCGELGLPEPEIMQSSGGLIELAGAAAHAALTVLSGPAGGVAGAAYAARAVGAADVLCFDMGGTSCDVCVIEGGGVQEQGGGVLAGRPVALPMVAVHTVGAGGGSIAWADAGGALRVGPRSAGADPGPACYGRGGGEPTVTDANVVLGFLDASLPLAGGVALDAAAAQEAVHGLAGQLGLTSEECARGIRRVACAEMAGALRVVTVDRGVDPRDFALMAFGGAGGLHATDIADELGIDRVLVPGAAGVLAALGLVVAPRRRDAQESVFLSGEALNDAELRARSAALAERALSALGPSADAAPRVRVTYELRYAGQSFELPVTGVAEDTVDALRSRFDREHAARYGHSEPEAALELVTIRVSAEEPAADVALQPADAPAQAPIVGPHVLPMPESTVLVPAGWSGAFDRTGMLILERAR